MPGNEKIFYEIMCGSKDKNIKFSELQKILDFFGFQCRIKVTILYIISRRLMKLSIFSQTETRLNRTK